MMSASAGQAGVHPIRDVISAKGCNRCSRSSPRSWAPPRVLPASLRADEEAEQRRALGVAAATVARRVLGRRLDSPATHEAATTFAQAGQLIRAVHVEALQSAGAMYGPSAL